MKKIALAGQISSLHFRSYFLNAIAIIFLAFLFAPVSSADAQRNPDRPNIEELLPETTVAFIQIPDIRDLLEKTKDSAGMQMLRDEEVAPMYERIIEEGRTAYGKVEEEVGLSLEELQSIPSGELVFCTIAPRRKNPAYMFILEIGEENEAAEKALGVARDKLVEAGNTAEDEELESGVSVEKLSIEGMVWFKAQREGLVVACSNEKVLNDFFLRWDGEEVKKVRPLSKNRKFITIMNRCRSKKELPSDIRFFVDPIGIFKSAGRGNVEMQLAIAFLPSLGLDSLLGMGGSVILGDEEYETIAHGHLLLSSPRKGVTKVLSLKPGDYEPESWMPFDAHSYTTTSWDVPQMYNEIRGLVDLTMDEGAFDNMVQDNINDRLEMSLEEDILSQFSGRISLGQVTSVPGKLNSASWVVGLGLNNAKDATEMGEKLVDFLNENAFDGNIEKSEYEGIVNWAISDSAIEAQSERRLERRRERNKRRGREEDDMEEMRATVRLPRPTFAIIDNTLVITDSVEAFEKAVATHKGESESLMNDAGFVKMADQMTRLLGTDMPVALSYNQPKYSVQAMLEYGNADSTKALLSSQAENSDDGSFWKVLKGVMDDHELPSSETLSKYIAPQGWFATSDDTGYHFLWFQERLELEDE
jgi:hypothetical protein